MSIIKWRDSYATGVEEMDAEHHELIDIINQLYEMMREKRPRAELKSIYDRLHSYTENHFRHEEQMMIESEYDGLAEQQKFHKQFIIELDKMEADLLSADEAVVPVVYKFLREWWLNHIVEVDKRYGPTLS